MVQRDGLSPLDIARGLIDPTYLIGAAWLALPTSFKTEVIDLAIDANLAIVDKFPGVIVLGPMWEFIRAGLVGFWEKLQSATADLKIKAVDTMARIISGQSVDYALGLVTGLVKGFFVEGAAGIFIAVWDLVKGLKHLWNFISDIGKNIGGFPEDMRDIFNSFVAFGEELLTNIGPAIEELATQAGNPMSIMGLLSTIAEKGKAFAKEGGEKIAGAVLELFTKKGAEAEIGETVGSVIGQILWEVLFAVVTAGAGAAVTAGKVAIKEAVSVLTKLIGKVVGSILKLIHEIRFVFGKVIEVVKKAVSFVKGKLAAIGNKLGELLEKVGNFLKRLLDNCHESQLFCKWPKHHPWPQYLGGLREQTLKKLPRRLHETFHTALDRWKGGKYARRKGAEAFKEMSSAAIVKDLREFYQTAEGGIFAKYLPDFEQAVKETKGIE
jgi:hypothetical protein